MRRFLFAGTLGLAACGGVGEDGAPGTSGADGANGSSCSVTDNGDGTATITCDDGTEATVGGVGPEGPSGADGTDGDDGATGPAGSDAEATRVIESFACGGVLEGQPLSAFYSASLFSSGDLFVSGWVRGTAIGASNSVIYTPEQVGYAEAAISISLDADAVADGGYFVLSLNRASLVQSVAYLESGIGVTYTWAMPSSACVHNFY